MSYARDTKTSEDKSRGEIERLLEKYGADEFGYVTRRDAAIIGFLYRGRRFELPIPMPQNLDPLFFITPNTKRPRSPGAAQEAFLAERRRRWRCLCLGVKAKLVMIDDNVATFEAEFLPYLVTGSGQTVAERMQPLIEHARSTNNPLMLPAPPQNNDA